MMVINIKNVLQVKGIKNPYPWFAKHGISKTIAQRYLSGKAAKVSLKHLELFCEKLELLPSELFIWQKDANQRIPDNHPLYEIHSALDMPNLEYYTSRMSLKELRKVEQYVKQLAAEEAAERKQRIEDRKGRK